MADYLTFAAFTLYAYVFGLATAAVATALPPRPPWRRAAAGALTAAVWPLALLALAVRRTYHRLRPRAATRPAVDGGPGLPTEGTQPCTEHRGDDRLKYGCNGPDPDDAEPLLTDQTPRDALHPFSRALRADVARRHPARPQPYATALARLLADVADLREGSADADKPGYRIAPAVLFDQLYLTAELARALPNAEETGRG